VPFFLDFFTCSKQSVKKDENILEGGEQNTSFWDFFDSLVSGPRGKYTPAIKRKLDSILPDGVWG
jgi:hypothetical protein